MMDNFTIHTLVIASPELVEGRGNLVSMMLSEIASLALAMTTKERSEDEKA